MKKTTIPTHWSADQALILVTFLEDIIADIWVTHGRDMARRLRQREPQRPRRPDDEDTCPF